MPEVSNYGSVEDQAEEGRSFDEKDTYYLNESRLTPEERKRKCLLLAVPLVLAVLIIGGFTLFLLRDFDFLYPGRNGGNRHRTPRTPIPVYPSDTGSSTATEDTSSTGTSTSTSTSTDSAAGSSPGASCLAHEKCTGLTGDCCPSIDGLFLQCCN
ncbi:expressed unknown protein [Seminavis robusta]|uniref:Uncharacterized protein n=1 Tax=Seminavis robusta TaxID=568900 RepID=A0A9N8HR28_9STRA|nr:expressed unknown protein [Seminavis robusta]|eukprot:Sro1038_g234291.1  (155) ;mRNA; f:21547-22011